MSNLYGYGPTGFNNLYPNWMQGNSNQYYTGGTGSGLSNPGYYWYRSLRNMPAQGPPGNNLGNNPAGLNPPIGRNPPVGRNPPGPMGKSAPVSSPGK